MKQWHPVPSELAASLMKHRWTRENPAPEVVAYLWVWKLVRDGVNVSIRDVATYAGWTRWQARKLRERVSAEMMEWEETTQGKKSTHDSGQSPDSRRTPTRQSPDSQELKNQQLSDQNQTPTRHEPDTDQTVAGHSRASSSLKTKETITITKEQGAKSSLVSLWDEINDIREKNHVRKLSLSTARKRTLKARLKEHSKDDVLKVIDWWMTSKHERAVFLRTKGIGINTVISPSKFPEYLDFANTKPNSVFQLGPKKTNVIPIRKQLRPISDFTKAEVESAKSELQGLSWTSEESYNLAIQTLLNQGIRKNGNA